MDIQDSIYFGNSNVTAQSNWKLSWKKIQQCGFDFQSVAGLILSEGSNLGQHDIADIFEKSLILLLLVENNTRQLNSNKSLLNQYIELLSGSSSSSNASDKKSELVNLFANHAQKGNLVSLLYNISELSSTIDINQLFKPQQQQLSSQPVAVTSSTPSASSTSLVPSCNSTQRFVQPSALIPTSMLTSLFNIAPQQQHQVVEIKPSTSSCSSATTTPVLTSQSDSPISSPNPLSLSAEVENDDEFDSNENPLSSSTDVVPQSSGSNMPNGANNQSNTKRKRRPRAPAPFLDSLFCHSCGETQTSQWRRGPDGCKSLCNACGIRFANIVNKEKALAAKDNNKTISINMLLNDSVQADTSKNDAFPIVPTTPLSLPTTPTSAPKSIPFYSNTKLSYAPAPPPKKSVSATNLIGSPSSSPQLSPNLLLNNNNNNATHKRKLSNSTNTTLPIISPSSSSMKSHKTFHPFESHDLTASIHQSLNNLTASAAPTKFGFSSFPLDALSTIASSEALLINNDHIIN